MIKCFTLIMALMGTAVIILGSSCSSSGYSGKTESVTIGIWPHELNSLIYIAQDQKYFSSNGLNITIKNYSTVTAAVDGMMKGETDLCTASEFVLVGNSMSGEDIRTLGVIDKVLQVSIITRKDNGINNVADLKGRRIGVFKEAVTEFYLGRFLELNGITLSQVTVVDTSTLNAVDIFMNGTIDALVTGQPNISRIKSNLGDAAKIWPAQSDQSSFYNILYTGSWASEQPDVTRRFLDSLAHSENYIANNPDKAKTIIQNQLNYTAAYVSEVWSDNRFSLSLDQSLILAMEDEARWMISNKLTTEKAVPNFLDYIYIDGLKAVKPDGVRIAGK